MGHSLFKHMGRCSGNLHGDITKMFSIKTPSLNITTEGIFVGVVELQLAAVKTASFDFSCEKCSEVITREEFEEKIGITCMVCRKTKKMGKVLSCQQLAAICEDCAEHLSDKNTEALPEYIKSVASYIRITKEMKLRPYSDILKQNVRL